MRGKVKEGRTRKQTRHEYSTPPSFREKCGIQITPQIPTDRRQLFEESENLGIINKIEDEKVFASNNLHVKGANNFPSFDA